MKRLSLIKIVIFSFCLFLFNGCGLEDIKYLNAPIFAFDVQQITIGNFMNQTEAANAHFDFRTNDSDQESDIYRGTAIYYRIYNNYTTMNSEISNLSSLSSSTNSASSATKMIEGYKYNELGLAYEDHGVYTPLSRIPLFSKGSNDRYFIRLTNNVGYDACIKLVDSADSSVSKFWMYNNSTSHYDFFSKLEDGYSAGYKRIVPMRKNGNLNFDFGRKYEAGEHKNNTILPVKGDEDFLCSDNSSAENIYYVTLYAVAYGFDSIDFSYLYSGVLFLGSVAIDASTENN